MFMPVIAASASLCLSPSVAAGQGGGAPVPPVEQAPAAPETEPAPEPVAASTAGTASQKGWTVRFDPLVWWVSPAGDLRLPSSGGGPTGNEVQLSDLNLDTPEFTPAGAVSINADRVRFSFFGSGYSSDAEGVAGESFRLGDVSLDAGDPYKASFDFGLYELTVGYRLLSYDWKTSGPGPEDAPDVLLDLYGIVGGRFYDLDISVAASGADGGGGPLVSGTEQFFGDLIAGVRAEFMIVRDFSINVQGNAGGMTDSDRSSFSFDLQVFGEWRPFNNVGVQLGWRHTQYSLEDGEGPGKFEYEGSLAGMFAGVLIRF